MSTYYHATDYKNLPSILEKGILVGCDGYVYLTTDPEAAARFLAIRLVTDIVVVEVELDDAPVEESYDHNEAFFKCKAYIYPHMIAPSNITNILQYTRKAV